MTTTVCTACFKIQDTIYRLLIDRIEDEIRFHLAIGQSVALPNGGESDAVLINVFMDEETPIDDPIVVKLHLANGDIVDIDGFAVSTGDTRF